MKRSHIPTLVPAIAGGKPVFKDLLPYGRQSIGKRDLLAVQKALLSPFITQGPLVAAFEESVAKYVNRKFAVAFSSGTSALHGAANMLELKSTDEVIVPTLSFAASANCVLYENAIPVLCDVNPFTGNVEVSHLKKALTKKTKAILPVHFAGFPLPMKEIVTFAKNEGLIVIDDACHALGAEYHYDGIVDKVGCSKYSDMTILSFHPVKHITTGEGGMVLLDDENLYHRLRAFRHHGITYPKEKQEAIGAWFYEIQNVGYNYRITDIQCALGIEQMRRLDTFVKKRRLLADTYRQKLKNLEGIITITESSWSKSSYHLFPILLDYQGKKALPSRKWLFSALRKENIGVQVHYIPIHFHPLYQKKFGYQPDTFRSAQMFYYSEISLPLFPQMAVSDVTTVVYALRRILEYFNSHTNIDPYQKSELEQKTS